jgi:hypothetical protein
MAITPTLEATMRDVTRLPARQVRRRLLHPGWICLPVAASLLLASSPPVAGQDWLTRRAASVVKETRIAQDVSRAALEARMITATLIDLEAHELGAVFVGSLTFRVSAVEVQNGVGVRVHAYLHNTNTFNETVPAPTADLFVLVDLRGRRIEIVDMDIEGLPADATEIPVAALERVGLSLLFADPPREPVTATLKVGELGLIGGIPVHTGASPGSTENPNPDPNVWRPQ